MEVAQRDSGLRVCVSQTDRTRAKAARAPKRKVRKFSSFPSKSVFWRARCWRRSLGNAFFATITLLSVVVFSPTHPPMIIS